VLLMWWGGSALAALSSAALVRADDTSWLVGLLTLAAAQATVLTGRATVLPVWARWPPALGFVVLGSMGQHGSGRVLYLALAGALLLVTDTFASFSVRVSAAMLADPVDREFARARREQSGLTVASISLPAARGARRRLAGIARRLAQTLRKTDSIVVSKSRRVVVVLPGGDDGSAVATVGRALADEDETVLVGTAAFPRDGLTWAAVKEAARLRERQWRPAIAPETAAVDERFRRNGAAPAPAAQCPESARP
jgi:hypothetical protein